MKERLEAKVIAKMPLLKRYPRPFAAIGLVLMKAIVPSANFLSDQQVSVDCELAKQLALDMFGNKGMPSSAWICPNTATVQLCLN